MSNICNICGSVKFGPGPGGRLSARKLPPRCLKCKSLERHRAIRSVYEKIGADFLSRFPKALQFSKDPVVSSCMFQHYEYSIYGGHNNLDITNINHPDGAFNWIICNHVLEHIENDYAAVSELIRITAINGVIQLNVPGPTGLQYTNDWGFPDPKIHDHYREYGILDFIDRFASIIKSKSYHSMKLHCKDPVTGSNDIVFFLSSSKENLEYISSKCQ